MSPTNENSNPTDWPGILRLHGPGVWKTIYRIIGQTDAAQDCYQETFLSAFQAARRQHVKNWAGFLQALATRRALDWLRQRYQNKPALRLADDLDDAIDPVSLSPPPTDQSDLCQKVRRLLTALPPRQAQAFWLRYMQQMPISDIAEQLDTAPGNVSVLLNRAAAHLREAMQQNESTHHYGEAHA